LGVLKSNSRSWERVNRKVLTHEEGSDEERERKRGRKKWQKGGRVQEGQKGHECEARGRRLKTKVKPIQGVEKGVGSIKEEV